MTSQIWVSIGFMAYYAVLQIYDDLVRTSSKTNTNSRTLEIFRKKYKVPIRTFHAKQPYGFTSFRSIWINEVLLKSERPLLFTFHHEFYHLKHKHKQWLLFTRFLIALTPLTKYFVNWWIVVGVILVTAYLSEALREKFEDKANDYAHKRTAEWEG